MPSSYLTLLRRKFPWRDSFILYPIVTMIINALLASLLSEITNDDVVLLDKGG